MNLKQIKWYTHQVEHFDGNWFRITLNFTDFIKNKIETTCKVRATTGIFIELLAFMLDLIQLVDPLRISIITLKSILESIYPYEHSITIAPELVRIWPSRIEDKATIT